MFRNQGLPRERDDDVTAVNRKLLGRLAFRPHPLLAIPKDNVDDVIRLYHDARSVHHLADMARIPAGEGEDSHIDARVFLIVRALGDLRADMERIGMWHSRETGQNGMVGDFCVECGLRWPCGTRQLADRTFTEDGT